MKHIPLSSSVIVFAVLIGVSFWIVGGSPQKTHAFTPEMTCVYHTPSGAEARCEPNYTTCTYCNANPFPYVSVTATPTSSTAGGSFTLSISGNSNGPNGMGCTWSRTSTYGGDWTDQPLPPNIFTQGSRTMNWSQVYTGSPAGTATISVTCTYDADELAGGSYTSSATETVNPTYPDLVVGGITPTTAIVGVSQTYSATATNQGDASTGAGFTSLFQQASTASGGAPIADAGTVTSGAIGAGGTGTVSAPYTFGLPGSYYIRICADKTSSAGGGTITESDENNNCASSWTTIVVSEASAVGVCGSANGVVYANGSSSYAPNVQCSTSGTASNTAFPTAGNSVSWTCPGTNGGSPSPTCSASQAAPTPPSLPTVTTSSVTGISQTSATGGGTVVSNGVQPSRSAVSCGAQA
jgi:hypothetical protein